MGCPACGAETPVTAKFCEECGARLPRRCPACGHGVGATAKFCLECGERLAAAPQALPAPSAPTTPQSYTPRHLAEKILASRAGLEGERKQVTVLFADVVGSTELIRDLDPEDAQRLLDGVVTRMMEAVHRFEGTVSRAMGDGIMAMFGAPVAHEDHAVRACYAALAMQQAIRRYAEDTRKSHGIALSIRVGLHSGEVVVRLISDDLHMDYTALGPTVHLASRMEQLTRPETTALTAETLRLVEGYVQVTALGTLPVKGIVEPVPAYELVGTGAIRSRLQQAAVRGLSRFVGRQAELDALHRTLQAAQDGHGQLAALVGEPGVGKSRLVWEVTHSHRVAGWTILESGSVSYGKATSYLPIVDMLKRYCRIEPFDEPRAIREKVMGKLLALDRALESILTPLLALLDVSSGDPTWQAWSADQRRQSTLDALARLVLRESQVQPVLLVFEDLHWIDPETQAFLDSVVERLPTARILLLVNYRPEYTHGWGNKGHYTQLRIDPLGPESADELLAWLIGDDPSVRPLYPLLVGRTEGNPFFLEESVRTLVESGALRGERGAYRLVGDPSAIHVPSTVQAILAARIDRLPPDQKRLLQTAAVVGKDVPLALLAAVAGLSDEALRYGLHQLQAAEFVYEATLFPEVEYTFKHALTHEVAYGSVLGERRRDLHGQLVSAIQRTYPERVSEYVEQVAHHALRAEHWEQSVTLARQAAWRCMDRAAYQDAARWFERALEAIGRLPPSTDVTSLAIDLRLEARQPLHALGRVTERRALIREALTLAEALGDARRIGWASVFLMDGTRFVEHVDERAEAPGLRALEIARELGDERLEVLAHTYLANHHHLRGDFVQAVEMMRWLVSVLTGDRATEHLGMAMRPGIVIRPMLGECLAALGEFDEAERYCAEGLRMAEEFGHRYSLVTALRSVVTMFHLRGATEEAIAHAERALELCRSWGLTSRALSHAAQLGAIYSLVGRLDQAIELLEGVERQVAATGFHEVSPDLAIWLAMAYLKSDRLEDAELQTARAVNLAVARDQHASRGWALLCAGEAARCSDPPDADAAESAMREALVVAEERGMRPLQAHCHIALGKLFRRIGHHGEACGELTMAIAMLREMGMAFWLPEAEAELAETTASPTTR